jgi:hypothetical protein
MEEICGVYIKCGELCRIGKGERINSNGKAMSGLWGTNAL